MEWNEDVSKNQHMKRTGQNRQKTG